MEKENSVKISDKKYTISYILDLIMSSNAGINPPEAVFIMTSLVFGAAVVILPYTVAQLGPVTWFILVTVIFTVLIFCMQLVNTCCAYMLEKLKDSYISNDAYSELAELAGGPPLRTFVTVIIYAYSFCSAIAWLLLAVTVFADIIHIPHVSYYNQVRCITIVCISLLFPVLCLGTYDDLKITAVTAVLSSALSLVGILLDTTMIKLNARIPESRFFATQRVSAQSFFSCYGSIAFAAAGPTYVLPNMYIFLNRKDKCKTTIVWTYSICFVIYLIAGLAPYSVFGAHSTPAITTTIQNFLRRYYPNPGTRTVLILAQLLVGIHLVLVVVIGINPVFQSAERMLGVPKKMSWKRIGVRLILTVVLAVICVAFPNFKPVLSLVGGVPITIVTIILPMVIYTKLFETSTHTKILFCMIGLIFITLLIGNLVVGVQELVQLLR